jgi:GNAT superfamily N-acetyltransferase
MTRRPPSGESRAARWVVDEATPAVLPVLADMMAESPLLARYRVTKEGAEVALVDARRQGDLILACHPDESATPIGLAWAMPTRVFGGGGYLRLLLVAEGRQGQGIGTLLLEAAEERARAWGDHFFLLASADNCGARRFYDRHGYRFVGVIPDLVVAGIDETLYYKRLT